MASNDGKTGGVQFSVGFGGTQVSSGGESTSGGEGGPAPFRIVLVSALAGRADHAVPGGPARRPMTRFFRATFDEAMASIAPEIVVDVPDPVVPGGPPLRAVLRFASMKDFRPTTWPLAIPPLRALLESRAFLVSRQAGAEGRLEALLGRTQWVRALLDGMPKESAAPAPAPADTDLIDSILGDAPIAAQPAKTEAASMGTMLASYALGRPVGGPERAALARIDAAIATLLDSLLGHPEVRRLERAFRGLRLLVDHADAKAGVVVDVVVADHDEVEAALESIAALGGDEAPVELIVVDHAIAAVPRDVDRLGKWALLAERMRAPVVANGHPALLGVNDMIALSRTQRDLARVDDPRATLLRNVAARDESRWVALVVNDVLARGPHTPATHRIPDVTYAEDASRALYASAAVGLAALAAQSHAVFGWACAPTAAPEVMLHDLAVGPALEDPEAIVSLEVTIDEPTSKEAARTGMAVLRAPRSKDKAFASHAPVVHRGPSGPGGIAPPATTTLGEQLFVSRLSHAIEQLAAALPATTDPRAASDVARLALAEVFAEGRGPKPELTARVEEGVLFVSIRPRGFLGIAMAELELGARLSG